MNTYKEVTQPRHRLTASRLPNFYGGEWRIFTGSEALGAALRLLRGDGSELRGEMPLSGNMTAAALFPPRFTVRRLAAAASGASGAGALPAVREARGIRVGPAGSLCPPYA